MNKIVLFLATLGPIGTKLPAPGTMGSLVGTIAFAFLTLALGFSVIGIALCLHLSSSLEFLFVQELKFCLDRNDPERSDLGRILGYPLYLPSSIFNFGKTSD